MVLGKLGDWNDLENHRLLLFLKPRRAPRARSRAYDAHAILCVTNVSFHCVLSPIIRQELNHETREIHERSQYRTVFRVFRVFRGSLIPISVGCPSEARPGAFLAFVVERQFSCLPTKKARERRHILRSRALGDTLISGSADTRRQYVYISTYRRRLQAIFWPPPEW
jgi:hypothetical protein